jgi:hypothetical protein
MNIPGYTAEFSLSPTVSTYRRVQGFSNYPSGRTIPQFRIQSGVDLGSYLRCLANGGDDLTCRFFGGLPPFTIGGLLF